MTQELRKYRSELSFRLRLEARLKNASLVGVRENIGLTIKEAAKRMGVSYGCLVQAENLKYYPSQEMQNKICEYYRSQGQFIYEEDAFPKQISGLRLRKYVTEREIPQQKLISLSQLSEDELPQIESGLGGLIEQDLVKTQRELVINSLDRLTPIQREIITQHLGLEGEPKSLELIANERGVLVQSIYQTLNAAIRNIRRTINKSYRFSPSSKAYTITQKDAM